MTNEDFQKQMNLIQEKIGKDSSALILDDIAVLLNDNQSMNKSNKEKEEEIERLKKMNETLQSVNGNLLQQVSMGEDIETKQKEPEEDNKRKYIDFKSCFDEKGNFKN